MKSHKKLNQTGAVKTLLICPDNSTSIESGSIAQIEVGFEGFPGEVHSGLTRKACSRFPYLYPRGTEIRNTRQLTLVSSEELSDIAREMDISQLLPGWLGANIEISGIADLTLLPPSTRLVFESNLTLVVDLENRPCAYPAQIINKHYPDKGRHFIAKALNKRGVTAWVEREGRLSVGDKLEVFMPAQKIYPHA
ncbi:MAG: hypothetical protein ACI845_000465 [Gammaproteobacteria bacterium]|jgi:hypothetical protein